MRKLFLLWCVVLLVSVACSTQPAATPQAAPTALGVSSEFTPTDPKTVNLAAGRPQLVEFYAVW